MSINHTSPQGLNVIRSFEGRALRAYQDSVGVWTIGYGNTNFDKNAVAKLGKIQKGLTITPEQAESLFVESIQTGYEPAVRKRFEPLGEKFTQGTMDAGSSFHYNCGAIGKASWPTALIKGDKALARTSILSWNKAGGTVLAGLTRRRNREWAMIDRNDYGPEGRQGPVEIGTNGRPTGKQLPAPTAPQTAPAAPLPAPEASGARVPGLLQLGDTGPDVETLNGYLVTLGRLPKPATDTYTDATVAAVEKYQGEHPNLTKDGKAGPATTNSLIRDIKMRGSIKKTGKTAVIIGGVGSGLATAGLVTLKVVAIGTGIAVAVGLIFVVMKHRTEIQTFLNTLRGKQVP